MVSYLSDHWAREDQLDFGDFLPALEEALREAATPLTVGLFGPWGSGKTTLLHMLRDRIEEHQHPKIRTVWFTAWKYDRRPALWRAFILRVLDALYPRAECEKPRADCPRLEAGKLSAEQRQLVEALDRVAEAIYDEVAWTEQGEAGVEWGRLGVEAAKLPAYLLLHRLGLEKIAGDLGLEPKVAEAVSRGIRERRMKQIASMEQFEDRFREVLKKALGEEGRLIVFVDDLDRCMPEKALQVLEAIKLFLEVEGCVFVLGMDAEVIRRGIEAHYVEFFRQQGTEGTREELPISGDVYLQKLIQLPFHLPPLGQRVDDYLQKLDDGTLDELTRKVLLAGLYPNPRQVKRVLNIFRLLRTIADTKKLPIASPLLAKTILIQTQWPELYRDWRQYPTLVKTLEERYRAAHVEERSIVEGKMRTEESETTAGGLLAPYLRDRRRYFLLERLLLAPPDIQREETHFSLLEREQIARYVQLAGGDEARPLPADLEDDLLSGDLTRVRDAVARVAKGERRAVARKLLRATGDPSRPPQVRAGVGVALALLGDPRPGVGLRADGLPDIRWCYVPAGRFWMGSDEEDEMADDDEKPGHWMELPAFYLSKYPVTQAQFRAFVEAGGYGERRWWTEAGWAWVERKQRRGPEDYGFPFSLDNHPVVGVSWYEAVAYTRWLTVQLRKKKLLPKDREVVLPSEAEWEKAARGGVEIPASPCCVAVIRTPPRCDLRKNPDPKRRYPWGKDPDPNRANYKDTGIGSTSAVGCFPNGASPCGVEEMSGNVWEWCRTKWEGSYRDYRGDDDLEGEARRVLRGGSFNYDQRGVRCAYRHWDLPNYRCNFYGFRLVVASPFSL